jgi:predicted signal transduction protein with EAL and GGDEF domain
MAAARLRKTLRDSDTLARVGGDEFVAVLPGTFNDAQIKLVTGRLLADRCSRRSRSTATRSTSAPRSASSVYPEHAEDEVRLVALADSAMSRAKETGKARCVVYSARESCRPAAARHLARSGDVPGGARRRVPAVLPADRRAPHAPIEGFETLMRWKHPTLGMVPPVRFIPIAETNGLINLLGAWALKAACVQLRQFEEVAKRDLYISVNISPRQFRNDKFLVGAGRRPRLFRPARRQAGARDHRGHADGRPGARRSILGKMAERAPASRSTISAPAIPRWPT